MNSSALLLPAAAALCLALGACGGKPAPKQEQTRAPVSKPETAATIQTPIATPAVESTHTEVAADKSSIASRPDTLPDAVSRTFPTAGSARSVSKPFPHRVVRDSSGQVLGYEVFSDSAGVTSMGYAGMVPVQVLLDAQAKPVRIYLLDNSESPAYMDIVLGGGLLERLLAFDPAKPESIDAVTFATCSAKAIIAGVTGLAGRVSAEIVPKPGQGSR